MEAGRILKLSVLSTQFCCESTTALKYGLALKKKINGRQPQETSLGAIFHKWFASSRLKEKYMSPTNFQNSIFLCQSHGTTGSLAGSGTGGDPLF